MVPQFPLRTHSELLKDHPLASTFKESQYVPLPHDGVLTHRASLKDILAQEI